MKSYKHHTELLHRTARRKKRKRKKIKNKVSIYSIRFMFLIFILSIGFFFLYRFINSDFFLIKNVNIIIKNNNTNLSSQYFNFLKTQNLFKYNTDMIKDTLSKYYPDYGLYNISTTYPSQIKIIIYEKIPVISVNNKYIIYQDKSMEKSKNNANTISINTNIKRLKTIFDIPGLASSFNSILNNRKHISSINIQQNKWIINTVNNTKIITRPGMVLPDLNTLSNMNYKVYDIRYKNMIIVKK